MRNIILNKIVSKNKINIFEFKILFIGILFFISSETYNYMSKITPKEVSLYSHILATHIYICFVFIKTIKVLKTTRQKINYIIVVDSTIID